MKRLVFHVLACVSMVLCTQAALAQQSDLLPIPVLSARVIDQTGTLKATELTALTQLAASIETQRGSQIAVLMVQTTLPEPIEDYANRVGNAWKLGRKGVGDGVLIVVAVADRKVRIEVARSLEGAIPDATAKRMIREVIAPEFKQGRYAAGLDAALHRIDERLSAEGMVSTAPAAADMAGSFDLESLLPFLVFGVISGIFLRSVMGGIGPVLSAVGAGGLAWVTGYATVLAGGLGVVVLIATFLFSVVPSAQRSVGRRTYGSGNWGGGGFGSSHSDSSGGFSSGGGGDFSGGGSSGDW